MINPRIFIEDVEVGSKVEEYGILFDNMDDVILSINLLSVHSKNFFEYEEDEDFQIISVLNGMNGYKEDDLRDLFKVNVKDEVGKTERMMNLIYFYILSETIRNPIFEEVAIWGNFPSSSGAENESMVFLKEALRVTHGKKIKKQMLIRNQKSPKKHVTSKGARLQRKCSIDFQTIIVNSDLKKSIKGKVVCIIDDYCTNGYSSEAAKHLLLKAGAKKVIVLTVGKYTYGYYTTNYELTGNVFSEGALTFKFLDEKTIQYQTKDTSLEIKNLEKLFGF